MYRAIKTYILFLRPIDLGEHRELRFMDKSYSGQSSYKFIDRLMRSESRALMIVTPFLDAYYARFLVGIAASKRVRIITTGKGQGGSEAVAILSGGFKRGTFAKIFLYFTFLVAVTAYLQAWIGALAAAAVAALVLAIAYKRFKRGASNIEIKVSSGPFVHEKIYIGSDEAITGSANLTYSGTHKNVEHIDVTDDPTRMKELNRHFEELWNSQR